VSSAASSKQGAFSPLKSLAILVTGLAFSWSVVINGPAVRAANEDGYIGCSMTANTIDGYRALGATRFWPTLGYRIGGGVLKRWSAGSSTYWAEYDQQISTFGPAASLVFMVCAGKAGAGVSNPIMSSALAVAEAKAEGTAIVILGQPEYVDGHLCKILGNTLAEQETALAKVRSAVAHALSLGAQPGPTMPELGPTTTRDGCHANDAGKALLGQALLDWEASQ
jgi:hypothetical protein